MPISPKSRASKRSVTKRPRQPRRLSVQRAYRIELAYSDKMDALSDSHDVNWSEVARRAVIAEIKRLEEGKG